MQTFHRIQGGADGDGDVDSDDINRIRRGIIFRDDPDADVNGDGVVNALDFFFARANPGAMLDAGIDRNSLSD